MILGDIESNTKLISGKTPYNKKLVGKYFRTEKSLQQKQ